MATSETSARRDQSTPARQRLLWRLVADALAAASPAGATAAVLDCGGGSGSFAVPLARLGARVTVVDVSVDALATLHRRAVEAGVADRVRPVQGDVEVLGEAVEPGSFDLALAHEVLGSVDHPDVAVAALADTVRPGGLLSIVIANPVATVLSRALAGDLHSARAELRAQLDRSTTARLDAAAVVELCSSAGLTVEQVHGIGVFSDFVPGAEIDAHPDSVDALAELESLASEAQPYRDIAGRVHVLARRGPANPAPRAPRQG